jgi:hypothetical protein
MYPALQAFGTGARNATLCPCTRSKQFCPSFFDIVNLQARHVLRRRALVVARLLRVRPPSIELILYGFRGHTDAPQAGRRRRETEASLNPRFSVQSLVDLSMPVTVKLV